MKKFITFAGIAVAVVAAVAVLSAVLHFQVRFLFTDVAVWLLISGMALFLLLASGREDYRIAWRQLRVRRLALVCGGIVGVFVSIGILDSFHFQRKLANEEAYESEVISTLDVLVWPLKTNNEKTFSAPLATHLFGKQTTQQPDGTIVFDYPRLKFGGAHLKDASDAASDILFLALKGTLFGALAGGVLMVIVLALTRGKSGRGIGAFLFAVSVVVGVIALLSTHYHVLGTDKIGQDVLYRALKGCRTGLVVGTITTLIVTPFALLFGIPAGYFGGRIDDVVQYLYTTISSIPDILLIAAAMLIVVTGISEQQTIVVADKRLMWLCIILGVTGWTELCRLLRAETLKIREIEYVEAARAFGVNSATIMLRHIVPNVMHIVLISVMLRFSGLVLFEAVLAFVGIGVDPSTESWGNLINSARLETARDPIVWWTLLASFLFMFGLVLPANIFGDAVRDALDPRLRTE